MSTIASEKELRSSYETITRMYNLRDRVAADTTGDLATRDEQVVGIEMMIRKIERQIAQYLAKQPEKAA